MKLSGPLIVTFFFILPLATTAPTLPTILAAPVDESRQERVKKWLNYLSDEDERVRDKAALELGLLGGPQAVEPLIKHLNAPKAWTRRIS